MSSNPKYRCAECHSTSVQIVVWYDPNADKVDEPFADDCTEPDMGPFSVTWCGGCSEHTRLEAVVMLAPNDAGVPVVSLPHGATGEYRETGPFSGALALWRRGSMRDQPDSLVHCTLDEAQELLCAVEEWDSNHYAEAGSQVPAIVAFVEGLCVFEETWGYPCDS